MSSRKQPRVYIYVGKGEVELYSDASDPMPLDLPDRASITLMGRVEVDWDHFMQSFYDAYLESCPDRVDA